METFDKKEKLIVSSYNIINDTANNNIVLQSISGMLGFPFTIIADGAVIFTHYAPMISRIQTVFNREPLTQDMLMPIFKSISSDLILDIAVDKFAGQLPVLGIYFNAICAKALTWRIGILFAILACIDEIPETEKISRIASFIRLIFPQSEIFKFVKPDFQKYKRIMGNVLHDSDTGFFDKVQEAINIFDLK